MGRSAGWLAYGAAIAGEASLVISVEDISEKYLSSESTATRKVMDLEKVVQKIVRVMRYRQEQEGKEYGVIVLAEGLAEYLPPEALKDVPRDEHGHVSVAHVDLGKMFAKRVADEFKKQTVLSEKLPACSSDTNADVPDHTHSTSCWVVSLALVHTAHCVKSD